MEEKIKERFLELHKESHNLIFNRADVEAPLTSIQDKEFHRINKEYQSLEIDLDREKAMKRKEEHKEEEVLTLTEKEIMILQIFTDQLPNPMLMKKLVSLSGLKRNRVYEHTRKFLFAGIIGHNSKGESYYLTSKGRQYIKQHLSETLRCNGVST